ncbi:diol dehydratase small subunit [Irregularibacter muris]|uniref:Diol dehydratase small subunit n=1 Tax=Irregularibacter muris TaxID=1796619 RepID=A0AAE3L3K2_9FIRM|nr:diol dehydratase small subunit [Irregularibacter muris]MCR1898398.1 diol dehydratase small subunit [Irregularibacter muris]
MIDNKALEQMIKDVMKNMQEGSSYTEPKETPKDFRMEKVTDKHYPLSEKMSEIIKTPTGKTLDAITMEGVLQEDISVNDLKIAPETLEMQAQVAESVGRDNFAKNLRRASELIAVPDERILEIYNALRPYRSTKAELMEIADELENKYSCTINAAFVREAAELYEKRGRLKA